MKNILVGFALWLALPCFVAAQTAAQTNIFDLAHSTSFAQYLMISQQYDLAAIEYERMTFMRPSSDSIKCLSPNIRSSVLRVSRMTSRAAAPICASLYWSNDSQTKSSNLDSRCRVLRSVNASLRRVDLPAGYVR